MAAAGGMAGPRHTQQGVVALNRAEGELMRDAHEVLREIGHELSARCDAIGVEDLTVLRHRLPASPRGFQRLWESNARLEDRRRAVAGRFIEGWTLGGRRLYVQYGWWGDLVAGRAREHLGGLLGGAEAARALLVHLGARRHPCSVRTAAKPASARTRYKVLGFARLLWLGRNGRARSGTRMGNDAGRLEGQCVPSMAIYSICCGFMMRMRLSMYPRIFTIMFSSSMKPTSSALPWVQLWMMPFMSRYCARSVQEGDAAKRQAGSRRGERTRLSISGAPLMDTCWLSNGYRSDSHL